MLWTILEDTLREVESPAAPASPSKPVSPSPTKSASAKRPRRTRALRSLAHTNLSRHLASSSSDAAVINAPDTALATAGAAVRPRSSPKRPHSAVAPPGDDQLSLLSLWVLATTGEAAEDADETPTAPGCSPNRLGSGTPAAHRLSSGVPPLAELFQDGTRLVRLASALTGAPEPSGLRRCAAAGGRLSRHDAIENCNLALGLLLPAGDVHNTVCAEDFVDARATAVAGFVWQLYQRGVGWQAQRLVQERAARLHVRAPPRPWPTVSGRFWPVTVVNMPGLTLLGGGGGRVGGAWPQSGRGAAGGAGVARGGAGRGAAAGAGAGAGDHQRSRRGQAGRRRAETKGGVCLLLRGGRFSYSTERERERER
eukprot:SAG25_NODE_2868_length_1342_cov_15.394865_1_plen_367_part_01